MKRILFFMLIILAVSSCRSVRKTTIDIDHQKDSTSYTQITTVDLDTTLIPQDSATLEMLIDDNGNIYLGKGHEDDTVTGTYSGPWGISVDQGKNIMIDYSVEKTLAGTKLKVKATTNPIEVVTANTTTETVKTDVSSDVKTVITEKKVKGFSMWNLVWVIPLAVVAIIIYLKRKTLLKYWPF